jgi:hypothetical protein
VILAAGLLVFLGLALFVAGILTGLTALYWACVVACVVAAVLLFLARRGMAPRGDGTARTTVRAAAEAPAGAASEAPASEAPASEAPASEAPASEAPPAAESVPEDLGEPPVEEVEVTDLLLVVDLTDEVLVVDEHPRYHLAGCVHLAGRTTIPLPHDEARSDGFTPCGACEPDRQLADRVRARKADGAGSVAKD